MCIAEEPGDKTKPVGGSADKSKRDHSHPACMWPWISKASSLGRGNSRSRIRHHVSLPLQTVSTLPFICSVRFYRTLTKNIIVHLLRIEGSTDLFTLEFGFTGYQIPDHGSSPCSLNPTGFSLLCMVLICSFPLPSSDWLLPSVLF